MFKTCFKHVLNTEKEQVEIFCFEQRNRFKRKENKTESIVIFKKTAFFATLAMRRAVTGEGRWDAKDGM